MCLVTATWYFLILHESVLSNTDRVWTVFIKVPTLVPLPNLKCWSFVPHKSYSKRQHGSASSISSSSLSEGVNFSTTLLLSQHKHNPVTRLWYSDLSSSTKMKNAEFHLKSDFLCNFLSLDFFSTGVLRVVQHIYQPQLLFSRGLYEETSEIHNR